MIHFKKIQAPQTSQYQKKKNINPIKKKKKKKKRKMGKTSKQTFLQRHLDG